MKTYTIETIHSPNGGRVLGVQLLRHGKCRASLQVKSDAEQVAAFWHLRKEAEKLGGTHVRILGKREAI